MTLALGGDDSIICSYNNAVGELGVKSIGQNCSQTFRRGYFAKS